MEASPDISRTLDNPAKNKARAFGPDVRWRFLLLALAAAILFLGAIRLGDLTGYDDALYSQEAKGIVHTGDWLTPKSRGAPALEHPPLFVWTQAAFFSGLGTSDPVAKLPSALAALGTVLLSFWLARRLLKDALAASVAMFVMLATPYFIKYAGHAMTDVPATFLFLCAICAWSLAEENPGWYLLAGAFTAMALMVRGLIGLGLPVIFAIDLLGRRRRTSGEKPRFDVPWRWMVPALLIAFLPVTLWYGFLYFRYQASFVSTHEGWLSREVYGSLNPPWRRYTGVIEYAWMLVKSYWPWLPATIAGIVVIYRERWRRLFLLLGWAGTIFLLCAAAKSRVLRYMLPAYPAFAILATIGIMKWTPRRIVERAMDWIPPAAVVAAIALVVFVPPAYHASEIRAISAVHNRVLAPGERVGFYDKGDPRYDETNELEWYSNNVPEIFITPDELDEALKAGALQVYVVDDATFHRRFQSLPHELIAQSGHLMSLRLKPR